MKSYWNYSTINSTIRNESKSSFQSRFLLYFILWSVLMTYSTMNSKMMKMSQNLKRFLMYFTMIYVQNGVSISAFICTLFSIDLGNVMINKSFWLARVQKLWRPNEWIDQRCKIISEWIAKYKFSNLFKAASSPSIAFSALLRLERPMKRPLAPQRAQKLRQLWRHRQKLSI